MGEAVASMGFSPRDLAEIRAHGVELQEAERQMRILARGGSSTEVLRPCTIGDGVEWLSPERVEELAARHVAAAARGELTKFVPASGAASRMFKDLLHWISTEDAWDADEIRASAARGHGAARTLENFVKRFQDFAFAERLTRVVRGASGDPTGTPTDLEWETFLRSLLEGGAGLGYAEAPKGLLAFHREGSEVRTAFDEQLAEAVALVADDGGRVRTHFTVSKAHLDRFREASECARERIEALEDKTLEVEFSIQKPSTDTLALAEDGTPFRTGDGKILFRPAGHGALIENLEDLDADVVMIKNVDNIGPAWSRHETIRWSQALVGRLLEVRDEVHGLLRGLESGNVSPAEVQRFLGESMLDDRPLDSSDAPGDARARLNRPIRVCGMVRNTGEPGGGPFWVVGEGDHATRQIVESAQIDLKCANQAERFAASSHFNPVFMAGSIRDAWGKAHSLDRFIDHDAVIVTAKSQGGRSLRALERPGLWNGAMAEWITIFVEVPLHVFTPVKTVMDLTGFRHQPAESFELVAFGNKRPERAVLQESEASAAAAEPGASPYEPPGASALLHRFAGGGELYANSLETRWVLSLFSPADTLRKDDGFVEGLEEEWRSADCVGGHGLEGDRITVRCASHLCQFTLPAIDGSVADA